MLYNIFLNNYVRFFNYTPITNKFTTVPLGTNVKVLDAKTAVEPFTTFTVTCVLVIAFIAHRGT